MNQIPEAEYEEMIADAEVLARNDHGISVLRLLDGRFVKLFRRRGWWSSSAVVPYSARFVRSAQQLARIGVRTVQVEESFRVGGSRQSGVIYRGISGATAREILTDPAIPPERCDEVVGRVASFYARLHQLGVYFRGNHFGNIVLQEGEEPGLIDITEVQFARRPLGNGQRVRNLKPPLRYPEDRAAIEAFGADRFIGVYLKAASLRDMDQRRFIESARRLDSMFSTVGTPSE